MLINIRDGNLRKNTIVLLFILVYFTNVSMCVSPGSSWRPPNTHISKKFFDYLYFDFVNFDLITCIFNFI